MAELEVRVETLEGTAADHETRISAAEVDVNGNSSNLIEKYFVMDFIARSEYKTCFIDIDIFIL